MGRSRALGMDRWCRMRVHPRWRLAQVVPRVQVGATLRVLVQGILQLLAEEKLRVREEAKFPQQLSLEQVAMLDWLDFRCLK